MSTRYNLNGIPKELIPLKQWILWNEVPSNDGTKPRKVPCDPHGRSIDPHNSGNWLNFSTVASSLTKCPGKFSGPGFVFSDEDPFTFIDLDKCLDEHGLPDERSQIILEHLNSFMEISHSGNGLHIFVAGKIPNAFKSGRAEIYSRKRFCAITGNVPEWYEGSREIEERQVELDVMHRELVSERDERATEEKTSTAIVAPLVRTDEYVRACAYVDAAHGAGTGSRNNTLNGLAYRLREKFPGLTESQHRELCESWASKCSPPMDAREVASTVASAWRGAERNGTVGSKYTEPLKPGVKSLKSSMSYTGGAEKWPNPLGEAAFHGLAGELVRVIEPHSESSIVAILIQFLLCIGNLIGRSCYWPVDGDRHYTNIFAVLVGNTGNGRKGTAYRSQRRAFAGFPTGDVWLAREVSGLSSSEGLIWAVRDPIDKVDPESGEVEEVEAGEKDKRLLVVESEFCNVLRQTERAGNTLSALIRIAWETGRLQSLTKNSPAKATDAHISIIGHITQQELLKNLNSTETANGFANRFIWVCVKRSKELPSGGNLQDSDFSKNRERIAAIASFTTGQSRAFHRDAEAERLWCEKYSELTAEGNGLAATITARGTAQVMRLALIYAVLDMDTEIKLVHLQAGLAVWHYSEQSAECIFGDSLGDPVADEITNALRSTPMGMTRTQIRDLFQRNRNAAQIDRALAVLISSRRAHFTTERGNVGKSVERWFYGPAPTT